jgi:predicted nucleic-acid-binding Zn-ribbon protein
MVNQGACPKCGSSNIIPKQKVVGSEFGGSIDYRVIIRLREKSGTWRVKHYDHPLVARVCGDCGYTELYTAHPPELASVYQRLQQTQSERGRSDDDDKESDSTSNRAFLILAGVLILVVLLGIIALALALGTLRG